MGGCSDDFVYNYNKTNHDTTFKKPKKRKQKERRGSLDDSVRSRVYADALPEFRSMIRLEY